MKKLELEKVAVSKNMICDIANLVENIMEEQEFLEGVFYLAEGGIGSILEKKNIITKTL